MDNPESAGNSTARAFRNMSAAERAAYTHRLHTLVNRLTVRGQWTRAAKLFRILIEPARNDGSGHAQVKPLTLWRYAQMLRAANNLPAAEHAFRQLVIARSHEAQHDEKGFGLAHALIAWADCVAKLGNQKAATDTYALAKRIKQGDPSSLASSKEARPLSTLIGPAISRLTFGLSLIWRSGTGPVELVEEGPNMLFRDQFRFDEGAGYWLDVAIRAPSDSQWSHPCLTVCVRFPWRFAEQDALVEILSIVNDMNSAGSNCAASFDRAERQIVIRSNIFFTGYLEEPGVPDDDAHARGEATLNLLAQVFELAGSWEARVNALANPSSPSATT